MKSKIEIGYTVSGKIKGNAGHTLTFDTKQDPIKLDTKFLEMIQTVFTSDRRDDSKSTIMFEFKVLETSSEKMGRHVSKVMFHSPFEYMETYGKMMDLLVSVDYK